MVMNKPNNQNDLIKAEPRLLQPCHPPENSSKQKPKRFSVEEKTEIAMMYADGQSIKTIAEKFGRTDTSIRLLVSKMGVKRGQDILNPSPDDDGTGQDTDQPKRSKLDKPWYLK